MEPDGFVVDFPTLGDLWSAWMERHCRVPDRHERGKPFREYDWQFWCTAQHGRVREDATHDPTQPLLNQAFAYRRSQVIGPQKSGKGPWTAARIALAAVGPSEFAGWAAVGDVYRCADHGCGCGWAYPYLAGEPMGRRHPSPLIQVMATTEDQVQNIWRPLVSMIGLGPLRELLLPRGEFVRIVGESGDRDMDRVDKVTASATSRLGAPLNEAFFDESGLYTTSNKLVQAFHTMRRGAAAMGGRSVETTNAFDPAEGSAAQQTMESRRPDIFRFWRDPSRLRHRDGTPLRFADGRDRRRILAYVYAGSEHVNLASVEAEALELMELDPAQAERFFGNMLVRGRGSWLPPGLWDAAEALGPDVVESVCLGFDGSTSEDWTAIRAETRDGWQFTPTYGPDSRPAFWDPSEWGGRIPRSEVQAALREFFSRWRVLRMYCDPRDWQSEIDGWALEYGDEVVVPWATYRVVPMHAALERARTDLQTGELTHDGCAVTATQVGNARMLARSGERYILGKPSQAQKIDLAVTSVVCHEAAADARAAGWPDAVSVVPSTVFVMRRR